MELVLDSSASHFFSSSQLFGDTVNCASRMESNGKPGMIQCSQKTADILTSAGKGTWLAKREEMVQAKGKGMLQTYWVEPRNRSGSSSHSPSLTSDDDDVDQLLGGPIPRGPDSLMNERLVKWNMEHFTGLVKRIVARRAALEGVNQQPNCQFHARDPVISPRTEITEIISLPSFDFQVNDSSKGPPAGDILAPEVVGQLRHFISTVAHMYQYVQLNPHRTLEYLESHLRSFFVIRSPATIHSTTSSTRRT
jgi:Adenylate and Guanylate cyclase catalytic domain